MKRIVPIFHSLSKSMRAIHKLSCDGVSVVQSTIVYEITLLKNSIRRGPENLYRFVNRQREADGGIDL